MTQYVVFSPRDTSDFTHRVYNYDETFVVDPRKGRLKVDVVVGKLNGYRFLPKHTKAQKYLRMRIEGNEYATIFGGLPQKKRTLTNMNEAVWAVNEG